MNPPFDRERMLKLLRDNPGMTMMFVGHDDSCPGAHGQPSRCCCKPTIELSSAAEVLKEAAELSQRRKGRRR